MNRDHLGQLRHLYMLMTTGQVKDTAEAARGLLGPAIQWVEGLVEDAIDAQAVAEARAEQDEPAIPFEEFVETLKDDQ